MIRFLIFLISLIILLGGCQKEDNNIEFDSLLERTNNAPDTFQIMLLSVSDTMAVIEWGKSVDKEKDLVTYKIYLLDSLYAENIQKDSIYIFRSLKPNSYYIGKIIATDGIRETSLNFSFYTKVNLVEWERTYTFPINKVEKTSDGGYISYSTLIKNSTSMFLLTKLKADGSVEWHKEWSDFNSPFIKLSPTDDGGYIVTNGKQIVKTDSQGIEIWKYNRTNKDEMFSSAVQCTDGGYFALFGNKKVIKFDSNGYQLWTKEIFFNESTNGGNYQLIKTSDNNYILQGTVVDAEKSKLFLKKIDSNGNEIWKLSYDNTNNTYPQDIFEGKSGNLIFHGFSTIGDYSKPSGRIIITKSNGEVIKDQILDLGPYGTHINAVSELPNMNLVIVGTKEFYYNDETFVAEVSSKSSLIKEDNSYLNYGISDVLTLNNDSILLVGIKPFPLFSNEINYWICKRAMYY